VNELTSYHVFDAKVKFFNHKIGEWEYVFIKNIYDFYYDKERCELVVKYITDTEIHINSSYKVSNVQKESFSCGVITKEQYRTYNLNLLDDEMILKRMEKFSNSKRVYSSKKSFKSNKYRRKRGVEDKD
jgi:hypothetical protein